MSLDQVLLIEEMGRALRAQRLADAAQYRLALTANGARPSTRARLAQGLRALASVLDGDATVAPQTDRRFARAV